MTKALINALAMALALDENLTIPLPEAIRFAEGFVEDNPDLFERPPLYMEQPREVLKTALTQLSQPTTSVAPAGKTHDTKEAAYGTYVPVVGPDGLTDKQRAAIGNGGLCPNCQQPNSDHLPGCARASGEDPKAITKKGLPPAV